MDKSPSDVTISAGNRRDHDQVSPSPHLKDYGNLKSLQAGDAVGKRSLEQSFSFSEGMLSNFGSVGISAPRQPALSRVLSEKSISAKSKAAAGAKSGTNKASPFFR